MRDPELTLSLLSEMSEGRMGRLLIPKMRGGDEEGQRRYHHAELLVDVGHAEWANGSNELVWITNVGYDFLTPRPTRKVERRPERNS